MVDGTVIVGGLCIIAVNVLRYANNEIEYNKAWLKRIEEELKEKEVKEGVVTWDDVREAFGYGRS